MSTLLVLAVACRTPERAGDVDWNTLVDPGAGLKRFHERSDMNSVVAARRKSGYQPAEPPEGEKPMRRVLSAVAALTMLSAQPVLAERQCSSITDQSAFEVQALRSQLMVLATGCHDNERYNAFIRRYQSDLQANERTIDSYFQHRYGHSGQFEHDKFVTELANAISRHGSDLGGDFCPRDGLIFNEVLALESPTELGDFAAGKNLVPASVDICAPLPTRTMAAHRAVKVSAKKKH